MADAYRTYKTAKKQADGAPVIRVSDLYVAGVLETDEVAVIGADGSTTGHITMRHLDRLGNGNYAIAVEPVKTNAYVPPTTDRVGIVMGQPEAVALLNLLNRVLADEAYVTRNGIASEKWRWTRNRLERVLNGTTEGAVR